MSTTARRKREARRRRQRNAVHAVTVICFAVAVLFGIGHADHAALAVMIATEVWP